MSSQEKPTQLSALQRAALLVEKMQARLDAQERARTEPIAVIGLGCRFPGGVRDGSSFWRLLREGVDAVREVPASRWDVARYYDPEPGLPGKMYGLQGGFLDDDVERFDADFFGISPREAASMDPQQRLVLEVAWEALENAGVAPDRLVGSKTGVFLGVMSSDYLARVIKQDDPTRFDAYSATGNGYSFVPGRLSYVLGLQGPSMPVDTACSSSLVSLHLAIESLRAGESDMALAGGVNLILSPETTICLCSMQALAGDGRCKTFDASADGYVRGEGCGILVLKRLSDARRDGDEVLALLRGSAVNHDGASGGLTVPNGPAQQAVVRRALENARIPPALVGYVEAHGTGTSLGDPIELRALGAVLGKERPQDRPIHVGSVKTNIGHLEPAAGIAGVIKTILALRHEELPRHLHFKNPNPHVDWERLPVRVPTEHQPWPAYEGRRIAGVSSFGLSGINAHVVLEQAPESADAPVEDDGAQLVVLSAKTPGALSALAEAWRSELGEEEGPAGSLADISYTSVLGRAHHDHRLALSARSTKELVSQLGAFAEGESHPGLSVGRRSSGNKLVFVFPGQGSQWQGMGQRLYARDAVFRQAIDRCDEAMRPYVDWSLRELLVHPEKQPRWNEIDVIQPALFALQVALAAVWRSLGIEPHAVVGHSMGEVAAAHVAGALSLEDAARIICQRSKLLRRVSGQGAMAVVDLSREQAAEELRGLEDRIAIAVSNSPRSTVLSGDPVALGQVLERLEQREVFCRRVKVDVASHSPQMDPLREELLANMVGLKPGPTTFPLYSTVTGTVVEGRELDPAYWVRNLREPVLFADSVQRLMKDGHTLFVELSPHPILLPFVEAMLAEGEDSGRGLAVPSLRREQEEWPELLASLGALYTRGCDVDWRRLHPEKRRRVSLPTYPWQRERHWLDVEPSTAGRGRLVRAGASAHPLLGTSFSTALLPEARLWESALGPAEPPFLADHRVSGAIVLPGAAWLEMALSAVHEASGGAAYELLDTSFKEALLLPEGQVRTVQTALTQEGEEGFSFQLSSQTEGAAAGWMVHASGRARPAGGGSPTHAPESLERIRERCREEVSSGAHYEEMARHDITYGPAFQGVRQLWRGRGEALGHVRLPEQLMARAGAYKLHPALLDACFQVVAAAVAEEGVASGAGPAVPVSLECLRLHESPGTEVFCHVRLRRERPRSEGLEFDLLLLDETGRPRVEALGLRLQQVDRSQAGRGGQELFFSLEWRSAPVLPPLSPTSQAPEGRWLLVGQGGELEDAVESLLREHHEDVFRVALDSKGGQPEAFDGVLEEAFGAGVAPRGVIVLAAPGSARSQELSPESLDEYEGELCGGVLHLVQALSRARLASAPKLWLVTRGVCEGSLAGLMQAPLWGLGRTLANEHAELRCTRVDLSSKLYQGDAVAALVRELLEASTEEEISLRAEGRYVARVVRGSPGVASDEAMVPVQGQDFRVEFSEEGRPELKSCERRPPGPGELELEVDAAALPGQPRGVPSPLGCSGRVVARGEGVQGIELGEERIALVASGSGSHVTVPVACTAVRPRSLSPREAAAVAATVLPVWYALHHLGRVERGQRVRVLGTGSGAGRVALDLARRMGAEVFEESGSEEAEVVVIAPGAVEVEQALSTLREGGRVLDLRASGARERLGETNVACFAVDMLGLARRQPDRLAVLWEEVVAAHRAGELRSLRLVEALRTATEEEAADAAVLCMGDTTARVRVPAEGARRLRAEGTYLITGGLGGLGLSVAGWMVEQGARHLVLLGRDTTLTPAQQQAVDALQAAGARVVVASADVSDREQLGGVLARLAEELPPLRGVLHAAGVLDDGVVLQQSVERFRRVMAPKVLGGWNLHVLTREAPLDFFVLYSSAASLFGAPGQGNYAAANAFLDALAHYRQGLGLPGLSINWGAFSEVGLAAAQSNRGARLAQRGSGSLTPAEGNALLGRLLDGGVTQLAVMPLDLQQWVEFYPRAGTSPWLSELVPASAPARSREARDMALLESLRTATSEEGARLMEQFVRQQAARVLRLDSERLDREAPLQGFGLDSLMGLELRNRLEAGLGLSLPASLVWKYPTLAALSQHLLGEMMDRILVEKLAQAGEASGPDAEGDGSDDKEDFVL